MYNTLDTETHHYQALTPETILDAIESVGLKPEVSLLALNSYENRVYQFRTEDRQKYVIKVYRPTRWSESQIQEEHDFCFELQDAELPVIAPLRFANRSLFEFQGYRFAIYPSEGGRVVDLESTEQLLWMGRTIARIHNVSATSRFAHRPMFSVNTLGEQNIAFLKKSHQIPPHIEAQYITIAEQVIAECSRILATFDQSKMIKVHGDCHPGNILWNQSAPIFMDFDDCMMAPAIQDLWMMIPNDGQSDKHWSALFEGYASFREPPLQDIYLIETLRSLRILHYTAWIARRWNDPTFQKNFSWFDTPGYWENQVLSLKEQLALLFDPPQITVHF